MIKWDKEGPQVVRIYTWKGVDGLIEARVSKWVQGGVDEGMKKLVEEGVGFSMKSREEAVEEALRDFDRKRAQQN